MPLRSFFAGDSRAAMVPFLAHRYGKMADMSEAQWTFLVISNSTIHLHILFRQIMFMQIARPSLRGILFLTH